MSKKLKTLSALICAAALMLSLTIPASAHLRDGAEAPKKEEPVMVFTEIRLCADCRHIGTAVKYGPTTYVPLLAFIEEMLDAECDSAFDAGTGSVSISGGGLELSLTLGEGYMVANGRHIYLPDGAFNINGTIVAPIRELADILSIGVSWDESDWSIHLDTSALSLPEHGDTFYNEEDLYWLSRVIYAESGNQSLEGRMGVGNVVLNRVNDATGIFPDSIQGVIFQPGQFSVVDNGTIYLEPPAHCVAAAKLCLEGYNTVENCLFFLNPSISNSYWFDVNRTFYATIGDHAFYA